MLLAGLGRRACTRSGNLKPSRMKNTCRDTPLHVCPCYTHLLAMDGIGATMSVYDALEFLLLYALHALHGKRLARPLSRACIAVRLLLTWNPERSKTTQQRSATYSLNLQ